MYKTYKIICQKCNGSRKIRIYHNSNIDWLEDKQDEPFTIVSGRKRFDNFFGWQCNCGHNSLMTDQEKETISNWASPEPQEIEQITKNLILPDIQEISGALIIDNFILKEI